MLRKEIDIQKQLDLIEERRMQLDRREEGIREHELSLKDKRNQLFKSYDALTEKIFQFDRECDLLKNT